MICSRVQQAYNIIFFFSFFYKHDNDMKFVKVGGPEKGRFKILRVVVFGEKLSLLLGLLGQEDGLNVGQHTTLGDSDTGQQFVQFLVVPDCQLQMSGDDTRLLVVTGGVTCQFQNFGSQVFHDGGQVHWGTGSDTFGVVALPQ